GGGGGADRDPEGAEGLQIAASRGDRRATFLATLDVCTLGWWNGRHDGLKIHWGSPPVRVQVPPPAPGPDELSSAPPLRLRACLKCRRGHLRPDGVASPPGRGTRGSTDPPRRIAFCLLSVVHRGQADGLALRVLAGLGDRERLAVRGHGDLRRDRGLA